MRNQVFRGTTKEEAVVNVHVDQLVNKLVYRKIHKPQQVARNVSELFEKVVKDTQWRDANELCRKLKEVSELLISKDRMNFVVRNCCERVMKMLKQACQQLKITLSIDGMNITSLVSLKQLKKIHQEEDEEEFDLFDEVEMPFNQLQRRQTLAPSQLTRKQSATSRLSMAGRDDKTILKQELQQNLLAQIRENLDEIDVSRESVTEQAKEHISDNDLILTFGNSGTLLSFFKEAHETCRFEVIVCETAPTFSGHKTAKELAESGIQTNLVQDAAVFAVMSRVDKVIISAHGIMATGGIISNSGALLIAHAAKAHEVPVFIVGAVYKMTPLYPIDSLTYNEFLSPNTIFRPKDDDKQDQIEAFVPAYDYVPPKLVSLILTNQDGFTPENIYRAFNDLYGKQGTLEFSE